MRSNYQHYLCTYESTRSHCSKQWVTVCKRSVEKYASHHQHLTWRVPTCEIERVAKREWEKMWCGFEHSASQSFPVTLSSTKTDRGTHLVFNRNPFRFHFLQSVSASEADHDFFKNVFSLRESLVCSGPLFLQMEGFIWLSKHWCLQLPM